MSVFKTVTYCIILILIFQMSLAEIFKIFNIFITFKSGIIITAPFVFVILVIFDYLERILKNEKTEEIE